MKTITVLVPLQIDVEHGSVEEVKNIIDNINTLFSINFYGYNNAQILVNSIDNSDIIANDNSEEEEF